MKVHVHPHTSASHKHTHTLDDIVASTRPSASASVGAHIGELLRILGWTVSPKSELTGATTKTFTGFEIDTGKMVYRVSVAKVKKLTGLIDELKKCNPPACPVPYKLLQRIEGTLCAMHLAVRPALLYSKTLARARTRGSEEGGVLLTEAELEDILHLPDLVTNFNGADISPQRATIFGHVDAGAMGTGARMFADSRGAPARSTTMATAFTEKEMEGSSTLRELRAALRLLRTRGQEYQGKCLCLYFDSKNAVRNLVRGGSTANSTQLQVCREIHEVCNDLAINLQPDWVARDANTRADALSKHYDKGALTTRARRCLKKTFGNLFMLQPNHNAVTQAIIKTSKREESFIVIVPQWRTQAWYRTFTDLARAPPTRIGMYTNIFHVEKQRWHFPPRWKMVAAKITAADVRKQFH